MKVRKTILPCTVACLCLVGCQTTTPPSPPQPAPVVVERKLPPLPVVKPEPLPVVKTQPQPKKPLQLALQARNRSPEQIQVLSDFAMEESPKIWQTIQSMRGEIAQSGAKIKRLRADLLEFDRDPDTDEDYKALVAGLQDLKRAYNAIFDKLEDAYIAAKKYEASPSCKDYQDTMKRALEDGIQDANMATERYNAMTRQK